MFGQHVPVMRASGFFLALLVAPLAWSHPGPGIVIDQKGQIFFVDPTRHRIMRVDAAGKLTVFAQGEDGRKLSVPHHLVLNDQGNLYSIGDSDGVMWRISPDGQTTQVYPVFGGTWIALLGFGGDPFMRDRQGNIYGILSRPDEYTQILEIRVDGRIGILAGGDYGVADGQGAQAKFANLHVGCFALGADGSLYVTDSLTWVRKISRSGAVTTLSGSTGENFRFKGARGVTCDATGSLYVADAAERCIYKITPTGNRFRLAGSGERGSQDGPAQTASFQEPTGVAADSNGAVYVLDYLGEDLSVRKISTERMVTTIAKTPKPR
jgi:DNA-binding beta-propeller fold protein YncE